MVPQCNNVEEECGNERVDNTVLGWSTDFFVAIVVAILTIHLYFMTSKNNLCSLAFNGLWIGFALKGFTAMYFGNSGIDDSKGMRGYYIVTLFQYALWTASVVFLGILVQESWNLLSEGEKVCGLIEYKSAAVLNILSAVAVITGCLWGGLALWNVVPGPFDQYDYEDYDNKWIPSEVLKIGQLLWHGSYSLCLVAAAYVWGALAKKNPAVAGGLQNSVAASGIIVSQTALVGIVIYYAMRDDVGISKGWAITESSSVSSTLVDYFMMMSIFFTHNLLYYIFRDTDERANKAFRSSLSRTKEFCLNKHDKEKAEDTDGMDSSEEGSVHGSEDNFVDIEKCMQKSSSTISGKKPTNGFFFFFFPRLQRDLLSSTQGGGHETNVSDEQKSTLEGPCGGRVVIRSVSASTKNISKDEESTSTKKILPQEYSFKKQGMESYSATNTLFEEESFQSQEKKYKSLQSVGPNRSVSGKKETLEKSLQVLELITSTAVLQDQTEQGAQRGGLTDPIEKTWQKIYTRDVDLWDDARYGVDIPLGGNETLEEKIRQSITRYMHNNEIEMPYNDVQKDNSDSHPCDTYPNRHIQNSNRFENISASSITNEISTRRINVENNNESRFNFFFWKRSSKKQEYRDASEPESESGSGSESHCVEKAVFESDMPVVIQNGIEGEGDTGTHIEIIIESISTISTQPSDDRKNTEFTGVKKVPARLESHLTSRLVSVTRSNTENEENEGSIQRTKDSHLERRLSKMNSKDVLSGDVKNSTRTSSMRSQIKEKTVQTNDDDSSSGSSQGEESTLDRLSLVNGIELSFDEDYLEQRSIEGGLDHIINIWNSADAESTKSSSDDEESVVSIQSSVNSDGDSSVVSSVPTESDEGSIGSASEDGSVGDRLPLHHSHSKEVPSEEELKSDYSLEHQVNRRRYSSQSRHSRGYVV
jgi:hypothetical protein